MVWFANWVLGLVTTIVGWLGLHLSKKTMFATAAIAAFVSITAAMIVAVKALAMGIIYALPPWAGTIGMLIPTNAALCIGALVSAKGAVFVYRYHLETVKLAAWVT